MNRYAILLLVLAGLSLSVHGQPLAPRPAATQAANAAVANKPAIVAKARVVQMAVQQRQAINANIKAQRDAMRQSLKNMPDGGTFKLEDLVHFSLVDGIIKAQWTGKIPSGQQKRIKIEGSDALWQVMRFNNGPTSYFNLIRYDLDGPPDGFWMCQIFCQEGVNVTQFNAQGAEGSDITQLSYVQQPGIIRFNIFGIQNKQQVLMLNTTSSDLFHLRNEHPEEVCHHLIPLLRKMTGQALLRPGAGDVYRVFTGIPADSKVTQQIVGLLPSLTSIDPIERDQATKSLRDLGAAGVLAALRFDSGLLLPEQFNRLNALVELHSRVVVEEPALSLKDTNFLLDCFEDEDIAVRIAAKAALENLLVHKIDFDPTAPPAKRTLVADSLRQRLSQIAAQRRELENAEIP